MGGLFGAPRRHSRRMSPRGNIHTSAPKRVPIPISIAAISARVLSFHLKKFPRHARYVGLLAKCPRIRHLEHFLGDAFAEVRQHQDLPGHATHSSSSTWHNSLIITTVSSLVVETPMQSTFPGSSSRHSPLSLQ
jgi:hypothetical protein